MYFVFLLIFGSFFLLNMILGVICEKFDDFHTKAGMTKQRVSERPDDKDLHEAEQLLANVENHLPFNSLPVLNGERAQVQPVAVSKGQIVPVGEVSVAPVHHTPKWQKNPACCICRIVNHLVNHQLFDGFIMFCIVTNTVTLALDEFPENEARVAYCEEINSVLTMIFIAEMALKLLGIGLEAYFSDGMNIFDAAIVIASIAELISDALASGDGSGSAGPIGALRAFRVFRVFKLARKWKSLQRLLMQVGGTIFESGNFALLLFLFIFIFSLVGMQFFAKRYMFDNDTGEPVEWEPQLYNDTTPLHAPWSKAKPYETPRTNFDDLTNSFLAVFQVLSGEDWNAVQYDAMRGVGVQSGFLYFFLLMVLGSYIVLNLFLAILLGNSPEDDEKEDEYDYLAQYSSLRRVENDISDTPFIAVLFCLDGDSGKAGQGLENDWSKVAGELHPVDPELKMGRFVVKDEMRMIVQDRFKVNAYPTIKLFENGVVRSYIGPRNKANKMRLAMLKDHQRFLLDNDPTGAKIAPVGWSDDEGEDSEDEVTNRPKELEGVSLFLFDHHSTIRRLLFRLMKTQLFENTILLAILVSSVCLAVDTPLIDPHSEFKKVLDQIDMVLVVLFIVEMCIRIISLSMFAYLCSGWNVLDFFIVVISLVDFLPFNLGSVTILRALRALRALRPLRMISRAPGMKKVVDTMLQTIPAAMNVLVVCSLFFLIFGIIGVGFFKGKLYYCSGVDEGFGDVAVRDFLPTYQPKMNFSDYVAQVAQINGLASKDNATHTAYAQAAIDNLSVWELVNNSYGIYSQTYQMPFMKSDCLFFNSSWDNADANFDNVVNAMVLISRRRAGLTTCTTP
jgi:hypothetical protein